jgi:uncharacterized membrane protein
VPCQEKHRNLRVHADIAANAKPRFALILQAGFFPGGMVDIRHFCLLTYGSQ